MRRCEKIKYRTIKIRNGDYLQNYIIYTCDGCGEDVEESFPKEIREDKVYCVNCAFKFNFINEKEFLRCHGIDLDSARAVYHDGEIHIIISGKFEWERKKQDRNYLQYDNWRTSVFKRDNYTCKTCGQCGGELNAHHIKHYATFPKLRLDINNGITLCKACHKLVHKGEKSGGLV